MLIRLHVDVPRHPTGAHLGAYYRDYAIHYGLMDKIRFGTTVESIKRDESRKLWLVKISGEDTMRPFDKIIYAVGTETKAKLPTIEGQEQFQGRLIHGQAYKRYESRIIYACVWLTESSKTRGVCWHERHCLRAGQFCSRLRSGKSYRAKRAMYETMLMLF